MGSARKAMLAIACLAMLAQSTAQERESSQELWDELDTVVIVGQQTPPLWKLSKKGHVLWILGTHRPQLRGFKLNSQRLDRLIAESQEVILPGPAYVASAGFTAMSELLKSDKNPSGASLQDLMPADAYAKWLALRQRYSSASPAQSGPKFAWGNGDAKWVTLTEPYRGGDGIDAMRPTLAWEGLRRAAMDRHGLVNYDLESALTAMAKTHNVPVRKLHRGREVIFLWNPDPVFESLESRKVSPGEILDALDYGDIGCLTANLDLLEPFMEMRKIQAAAWARGDLEAFRGSDAGARLRDCVTELVAAVGGGRLPSSIDGKKAQERYYDANRDSLKEVQEHWMRGVQDAVKKNRVTTSMVAIDQLLAEHGYLAALRDKGFVLEEQE
jgi:hypothetical protein